MLLLQLILQGQRALQDCPVVGRPRIPPLVLNLLHADLALVGRDLALVLTATHCGGLLFKWLLPLLGSLVVAENVNVFIIID